MEIRNTLQPDFSKAADSLIPEPDMLPGAVARQSIVQTHCCESRQAAAVKKVSSESPTPQPALLLVPSTPISAPSPITMWSHGLALTPEFPSAHTTISLLSQSPGGRAAVTGQGDSPQAQQHSLCCPKSAQCILKRSAQKKRARTSVCERQPSTAKALLPMGIPCVCFPLEGPHTQLPKALETHYKLFC